MQISMVGKMQKWLPCVHYEKKKKKKSIEYTTIAIQYRQMVHYKKISKTMLQNFEEK